MRICCLSIIIVFIFSCKKNSYENDISNSVQGYKDKSDDQIRQETGYVKTDSIIVFNFGYGGFKASDLLQKKQFVLRERPDLVIMMCGTNEVYQNDTLKYRASVERLIEDIRNIDADVMLLTAPPLVDQSKNMLLNDVNKIMKDICLKKKCYFADVNAVFSTVDYRNNLILSDWIHPTSSGYKIIAEQILISYMKNKLIKRRIACFGDSITYGSFVNGEGTATGDTYPGQLFRILNN